MFFNSTFNDDELEKEKNVVLVEIKMYEDTPDDIVHDMLSKAAYETHSLGYPILGTEETLATFTSDSLREYIHDMYTPDNVVISIAGNIQEDFIEHIERYFGTFVRTNKQNADIAPEGHLNKLIKQKETEPAQLCICFEGLPIG